MTDDGLKELLASNMAEMRRYFDEKFGRVEDRFERVDERLDQVDDRLSQVDQRFNQVDARFNQVDAQFNQVGEQLTQVDQRFNRVDDRFDEMRRHFDVTAEDLRRQIQLVAEGVMQGDEKLEREAADIRNELRTTAAETQAMIKFSHAALDRRITTLERAASKKG